MFSAGGAQALISGGEEITDISRSREYCKKSVKKPITIIRKGVALAYDVDEKGLSATNGCPETVDRLS